MSVFYIYFGLLLTHQFSKKLSSLGVATLQKLGKDESNRKVKRSCFNALYLFEYFRGLNLYSFVPPLIRILLLSGDSFVISALIWLNLCITPR